MGRDKRLERPLVLQHLRLKVETYFTRHLSRCKNDDDEIDLVVKVIISVILIFRAVLASVLATKW